MLGRIYYVRFLMSGAGIPQMDAIKIADRTYPHIVARNMGLFISDLKLHFTFEFRGEIMDLCEEIYYALVGDSEEALNGLAETVRDHLLNSRGVMEATKKKPLDRFSLERRVDLAFQSLVSRTHEASDPRAVAQRALTLALAMEETWREFIEKEGDSDTEQNFPPDLPPGIPWAG